MGAGGPGQGPPLGRDGWLCTTAGKADGRRTSQATAVNLPGRDWHLVHLGQRGAPEKVALRAGPT